MRPSYEIALMAVREYPGGMELVEEAVAGETGLVFYQMVVYGHLSDL